MIRDQFKRGKLIINLKLFSEKVEEDPASFLKNLIIDAEANG